MIPITACASGGDAVSIAKNFYDLLKEVAGDCSGYADSCQF